jgi:hypothetical protein
MTSWRRRIVATVVVVATPLIAAHAQRGATGGPRPLGRLLGVFDDATGRPVDGAEVVDLSTQRKTITSASGAVSLSFLEPGVTVLQIRKIGYESRMQTVKVSAEDTISITMLLKPLVQTLPEVTTTAASATPGKLLTFEQHRAEGFGHFLTQPELEKSQGRLMSDVLRTIPGMKLMLDPRRGVWYVGTSRGAASMLRSGPGGICYAAVMVDGILRPPPFDINTIRPEEMAGVEYYAGGATMPIAYNSTRAACGLVVIWTR